MCSSTNSGAWRRLDQAERSGLVETLRQRGLHLTDQREEILEVIFGCPGHICAEHILAAVAERRPDLHVNKTTVYRALDLLQELNLVTEHKIGDGPAQYEAASHGHHAHLICERCGESQNMDEQVAEDLRIGLYSRHGFGASLETHPIFGVCARCRS
jgi:Fur family transcriptional regulator, ferric uptake regulator